MRDVYFCSRCITLGRSFPFSESEIRLHYDSHPEHRPKEGTHETEKKEVLNDLSDGPDSMSGMKSDGEHPSEIHTGE